MRFERALRERDGRERQQFRRPLWARQQESAVPSVAAGRACSRSRSPRAAGVAALLCATWRRTPPRPPPPPTPPGPTPPGPRPPQGLPAPPRRGGTPWPLTFGGGGCSPGKQKAPRLNAAAHAHAGTVVFLGIDVQDLTSDAHAFLRRHDVSYASLRDNAGATYDGYGLTGVPETYWIDARGRIVAHFSGPVSSAQLNDGIRQATATR